MKRPILSLAAAALLSLLQACDLSNQVSDGGGDETHSSIDIQGVVLTGRSTPFAGIVVKLRTAGLSDTTDAQGAYAIRADRAFAASRSLAAVDTLDFYREGRIVHSELLDTWVEHVPDVILVQRDVSGRLTGNVEAVKAVRAVFGGRRADTLALEWNPILGSYSGFAYFQWSAGVDSYQVRIEARDSLGRLVGRSVEIPFTSRAGDLDVPSFDAGNARPRLVLSGPDSAQSREVLGITAVGSDVFGRTLLVRWPDQGNKVLATHVMPSGMDSVWVVHAEVADFQGLVTKDSLVIRRKRSPPTASVTAVVTGDSVRIHVAASDVNGGAIREKRVFLGRVETVGWVRFADCIRVNVVQESDWATTYWYADTALPLACTEPSTGKTERFVKLDTGIVLKGDDTVLYILNKDTILNRIRFSDQGSVFQTDTVLRRDYQVALVVTDEDGETTVKRSQTFQRDTTADSAAPSTSERIQDDGGASTLAAIAPVSGGSELPFAARSGGLEEAAVVPAPGARNGRAARPVGGAGAVRSPGSTPT